MSALTPASLDLPTLASLAGAAVSDHLLRRLRAGGHAEVRASHGYVFQLLIDGPKAVGDLARLLGVTQQAASKVVLELEGLGYVARQGAVADSRVKLVALTDNGRAVIDATRSERARLEAKLRVKLGERALASARLTLVEILKLTGDLGAVSKRRVKLPIREADALLSGRLPRKRPSAR